MSTVICKNSKTFLSMDLSSICPRRESGRSCPYCYVETARKLGTVRAKKEYDKLEYTGQILRMRPETLAKVRECGGLRLFSFGDYKPWMEYQINEMVDDAATMNIPLKAITKVPEFVHKFASKINVINVSVDSIGYGVDWGIARELRGRYANVYIRAAVLSLEDLQTLQWCDILTLNHSYNGFHQFSKQEKADIFARYPEKMCCQTGHCWDCNLKCKGVK